MNISFIFNADHEVFNGFNYAILSLEEILKTGFFQENERSKRFGLGDLSTLGHARTREELRRISIAATTPAGLDLRKHQQLSQALGVNNILVIVFVNANRQLFEDINKVIGDFPPYLGGIELDFSNRLHLVFYKLYIGEKGRLKNSKCELFYSMGDEENTRDVSYVDLFERNGFKVEYVDRGAIGTIFDNFDTAEHFRRVSVVKEVLSDDFSLHSDHIDDWVSKIEDVHPKLFDALAAAFRVWSKAETAEDRAQVATSVRRFLKLLADVWFPPRDELVNGREVTDKHVKNRLWAYLMSAADVPGSDSAAQLGKRFDKLWNESSEVVHGETHTREQVGELLVGTLKFTVDAIDLNPLMAAQPYRPYMDQIEEFLRNVPGPQGEGDTPLR